MKKNTLFILLAVIAVLLTASLFINSTSQFNADQHASGQKLFSGLYDGLNDISSLEISTSSGKVVISNITKDDKTTSWVVTSKDNYPANMTKVRSTLIALAELEKVEAKTRKQKNFAKLGVQDINDGKVEKTSSSALVLAKSDSKTIASLILGNRKSGHSAGASASKTLNYVRLVGDEQVWLAAGNLTIPTLNTYLNTELTSIPATRVQSINIKHPKGTAVNISKGSKTDKEFTLKQLGKGKELSNPGVLSSLASSLANFNFEDVMLLSKKPKLDKPVTVTFKSFNGLILNLNIAKANDKFYLWLDAKNTKPAAVSLKQEDVEKKDSTPDATEEAAALNKKHGAWLYTIASHKAESLTKQLTDLVKAKVSKSKDDSK